MSGEPAPRYVDEHRLVIDAPRERVWAALRHYCTGSLAKGGDNPLLRLLGTEPRAGFAVALEVPGERVDLEGRHRFSRYHLSFVLDDVRDGDVPGGGALNDGALNDSAQNDSAPNGGAPSGAVLNGGGRTGLTARTFADFPGLPGRVYRALVIGSGGHAVAVRGMLRSVSRASGA